LRVAAALFVVFWSNAANAEGSTKEDSSTEHTFILGVGGAAELELGDGSVHAGANVMLEWEAIEDWLELELGASVLSGDGGVVIPAELLFKKPFRLSQRAEMMVGVGPEVVRVTGRDEGTFFGAVAGLDFMFWPWGRRWGLWVNPEYDLLFKNGASSGLGATAGVLLGW
jgi:hypothetical protein